MANNSKRSVISLEDISKCKEGLRPFVSLEEKVRLALVVAFSVLQLSKTPWLPEKLTRNDVCFFRHDNRLAYNQPVLLQSLPENPPQVPEVTSTAFGCSLRTNPTLFALGILLLEIILGSTLEQRRGPKEHSFGEDGHGFIRDSITAHKLLEQRVAFINPAYKAIVERCIGCTEPKALDEDSFRECIQWCGNGA